MEARLQSFPQKFLLSPMRTAISTQCMIYCHPFRTTTVRSELPLFPTLPYQTKSFSQKFLLSPSAQQRWALSIIFPVSLAQHSLPSNVPFKRKGRQPLSHLLSHQGLSVSSSPRMQAPWAHSPPHPRVQCPGVGQIYPSTVWHLSRLGPEPLVHSFRQLCQKGCSECTPVGG